MDNEMIERCVQAVAQADEQNGAMPYDARMALGKHAKAQLLGQVLAVIKAMREPTEAMVAIDAPDMPAGGDVAEIWRDMIDSITGCELDGVHPEVKRHLEQQAEKTRQRWKDHSSDSK